MRLCFFQRLNAIGNKLKITTEHIAKLHVTTVKITKINETCYITN